jgi:hypothetical protein
MDDELFDILLIKLTCLYSCLLYGAQLINDIFERNGFSDDVNI